jgi:hypothetical protein
MVRPARISAIDLPRQRNARVPGSDRAARYMILAPRGRAAGHWSAAHADFSTAPRTTRQRAREITRRWRYKRGISGSMRTLFYDDRPLEPQLSETADSVFLAGPTARDRRTQWRLDAIDLLVRRGFDGTVIVPEFRDRLFRDAAETHFASGGGPVPHMKVVSYNVLDWETTGIERSTCVMFWMPFAIAAEDDPASLPGFTTRAEVSRELARAPERIVLGMPPGALSSAHIRYHAHRRGVPIHDTLEVTIDAVLAFLA